MKLFTKRNTLIILFVVFLFLRLFVSSPYVFLASDHVKYLELSQRFPYHTLSNNQLYLDHGPFYPYVIYFATLIFQEDYIASIFISLLSACITFFILYKLFMMVTKNFYITFTILVFFTLSVELIIASNAILKESFVIMLIISTIYYYVKGVKLNNKKSFIVASIFGGLTAITVDHVILLFPVFILSYIFFANKKINIKYAILPITITLLFYGCWISVKVYQYSINEYYPAGLEGAPVSTKGFGLTHLMNPRSFEDYESKLALGVNTKIRHYAYGLGYMFNIVPFDIPLGLNFTNVGYLLLTKHILYMIIVYLPLSITALFSFFFILKNFIKERKIHNNFNLYFVLLFLIFLFPLAQEASSPRYIYTAYIFLYYFISYGLVTLFTKIGKMKIYSKLLIFITIMLILLTPFWYYNNPNLVFLTKKTVLSQNTADFINNNLKKEDAIMAQAGYGLRLTYLTDNRVLGLPPKSENLLQLIKYYNVTYVLYGKYYTWDWYHYSKDSVEFIRNNPKKFQLVATIPENYAMPKRTLKDEIYIYKVI